MSESPLTDQRVIDRARTRQKKDRALRALTLRTLMSHADGRRHLWLELSEANVFTQTLGFGPGEAERLYFNEGKRSRGLALLMELMTLTPASFVEMLKENTEVDIEEPSDG